MWTTKLGKNATSLCFRNLKTGNLSQRQTHSPSFLPPTGLFSTHLRAAHSTRKAPVKPPPRQLLTRTTLVDSVDAVKHMNKAICAALERHPRIYLDLEGDNLSRDGTLSTLAIFVQTSNHVYVVDVHTLGSAAFTTVLDNGTSLKAILETPSMGTKTFFDVRDDSDALHHHFGVTLGGVEDVQLMELASRPVGHKSHCAGFANCIEREMSLPPAVQHDWRAKRDEGHRLFNPRVGGSFDVFNQRPISPELLQYCVNDVRFLPQLRSLFWPRLDSMWRDRVRRATKKRISQSMDPDYHPRPEKKRFGPWPNK